jgi:hypothetical protein
MPEDPLLSPVSGYPMFVIIAGSPMTRHPACAIGMRYIAGTEPCGDDQCEEGQFNSGEEVFLSGVIRFHDFKFAYWIGRDRGGLMDFYR